MDLLHYISIAWFFYALDASYRGRVHMKNGASLRWKVLYKEDSPKYFWMIIVIYLSMSILTFFARNPFGS